MEGLTPKEKRKIYNARAYAKRTQGQGGDNVRIQYLEDRVKELESINSQLREEVKTLNQKLKKKPKKKEMKKEVPKKSDMILMGADVVWSDED